MTEPTHDPAMLRFMILQLVRVVGVAIVAAGVLLWRSDAIGGAPQPDLGKALFATGLFLALVVPPLLRRRWRTSDRA